MQDEFDKASGKLENFMMIIDELERFHCMASVSNFFELLFADRSLNTENPCEDLTAQQPVSGYPPITEAVQVTLLRFEKY